MKRLFSVLLAIIILVPIIFFGVLFFVLSKPELYQEELQEAFTSATGLNIEIGTIGWRYWPPIALKVDAVKIRNPATREAVAQLDSAAVDINLLPLLIGDTRLQINGLSVDGLNLNLKTDRFGNQNWGQIASSGAPPQAPTQPQPQQSEQSGILALMPFGISHLKISKSVVSYQNDQQQQDLRITLQDFSTDSVDYDAPFPLAFDIDLLDNKQKTRIEMLGNLKITLDSVTNLVSVEDMLIDGAVTLSGSERLVTSLKGNLDFDIGKDRLSIKDVQLGLSDLSAGLSVDIEDVMKGPTGMNGTVNLAPFNAKKLLSDLDIAHLDFQDPNALQKLQLSATFNSDMVKYETKDLKIGIDNTTLKGTARIALLTRPTININVDIDNIDLASYTAPPTLEISSGSAKASSGVQAIEAKAEDFEVIPRDLVASYTLNARFFVDKLRYADMETSKVKLLISTAANRMTTTLEGALYGGSYIAKLEDNPDDIETSGNGSLKMKSVNITGLTGFEWITGTLNTTSSIEFSGSMLSQILNSLEGPSSFTINNGTLDVSPIKSVAQAIDLARGTTSSISQWPDKASFKELEGHHRFTNGQQTQLFDFTLENLTVDGRGGIDYLGNYMEYDMSAVIKQSQQGQFKVSEDLAGVRWPIKCKGRLDESPTDICRPKSGIIKDLVKDMAKKKVKGQVQEKVKDKAKELLKGLFK